MRLRAFAMGIAVWATACAHGGEPSAVEARAWEYRDGSGLRVGSYGAGVRQRLPGGLVAGARALADHVVLDSRKMLDPTMTDGPRAPDAVTSASATAGGGTVARKWRVEGLGDLALDRTLGGVPVVLGAMARTSREEDYASVSAALRAGVELGERNTTLQASAGYGRDEVDPVEAPPGQDGAWPATHDRWSGTAALSQIVSPSVLLSAGAGLTRQRGMLASPYRRALVKNLLLPEAVPHARDRLTAFAAASIALGDRAALHVSQGLYADSWDVAAIIPEATLSWEADAGVVVSGTYRIYLQREASFYQATYDAVRPLMTGDLRLGRIRDQTGLVEIRWLDVRGGDASRAVPIVAGYQLSVAQYDPVGARVVAHIFSLGAEMRY